jgi:hypothetical protein
MTAVIFRDREDGEPLAQYLHAMADLFGADERQRAVLREAAAMSYPVRSAADRGAAGRMAYAVQVELKASIEAVVFAAQARGERVTAFNDAGAVRVKGRDGLYSLLSSGALSEPLFNTDIAYRALFESCGHADVGSQLGCLTGQPGALRTSTGSLHTARLNTVLASYQLQEAELAVGPNLLPVLRAVAGEGRTIRSLSSSGHRRSVLIADLVEASQRVRMSFAKVGGLRITGH